MSFSTKKSNKRVSWGSWNGDVDDKGKWRDRDQCGCDRNAWVCRHFFVQFTKNPPIWHKAVKMAFECSRCHRSNFVTFDFLNTGRRRRVREFTELCSETRMEAGHPITYNFARQTSREVRGDRPYNLLLNNCTHWVMDFSRRLLHHPACTRSGCLDISTRSARLAASARTNHEGDWIPISPGSGSAVAKDANQLDTFPNFPTLMYTLHLTEKDAILKELHFGIGDGNLQYYFVRLQ